MECPELGISLTQIEAVVLSHGHFDHTGGLPVLLAGVGQQVPLIVHPDEPVEQEEPVARPLSYEEEAGFEERIVAILLAAGGEQYQSEIVKALGIPKSTVSSSLNTLHQRGLIQKVKKGRENLIRLVRPEVSEEG